MFANRFTVIVDACSLVPALGRNLILTLAEAEFFRVRWSSEILDETQKTICRLFEEKGVDQPEAKSRASRARGWMESAFPEAEVTGHQGLVDLGDDAPDLDDAHVISAAVKTRADLIVTENLRDFPDRLLGPLGLEARSADTFLADTIQLDVGKAVAAIRGMRNRLNRPELSADELLLKMEALGFLQVVDSLRGHVDLL